MEIHINYDDLEKLNRLTDELKNKMMESSLRSSMNISMDKVRKRAASYIRNSRLIPNISQDTLIKKKIRKSRIFGTQMNNLKSYLFFSTENEYATRFPTRIVNVGKYKSFESKILDKIIGKFPKIYQDPKSKFITLIRNSNNRNEKRSQFKPTGTSISDVLRFSTDTMTKIQTYSQHTFEMTVSRELRKNINGFTKGNK